MSADNITNCPKCAKIARRTGTPPTEDTLREDYSFDYVGGNLKLKYSACCEDCGFDFSINQKITIPT